MPLTTSPVVNTALTPTTLEFITMDSNNFDVTMVDETKLDSLPVEADLAHKSPCETAKKKAGNPGAGKNSGKVNLSATDLTNKPNIGRRRGGSLLRILGSDNEEADDGLEDLDEDCSRPTSSNFANPLQTKRAKALDTMRRSLQIYSKETEKNIPTKLITAPSLPRTLPADLQGRLAGHVVRIPAKASTTNFLIVEGSDRNYYLLYLKMFCRTDIKLLDRRQQLTPVIFSPNPRVGDCMPTADVLDNNTPPRLVTLLLGSDPHVVTTEEEILATPRIFFRTLPKNEYPTTINPKTAQLILRGHSFFGPCIYTVNTDSRSFPRNLQTTDTWLTALCGCSTSSSEDGKDYGFVKLSQPRPARPFMFEKLLFPERMLYDSPFFLEDRLYLFAEKAFGEPAHLVLGSAAPLNELDILALPHTHFRKDPKDGRSRPTTLREISRTLINIYEENLNRDSITSTEAETTYLRTQITHARGLQIKKEINIICHAHDANFYENLAYLSQILSSVDTKSFDANFHQGLLLWPTHKRHIFRANLYLCEPALTDKLVRSGLSFAIHVPNTTLRVCSSTRETVNSSSSQDKPYLLIVTIAGLDGFYTELNSTRNQKIVPGQSLSLPTACPIQLNLEENDSMGYRSDEQSEHLPIIPSEESPISIIYFMDNADLSASNNTAESINALVALYGKRFSKDGTYEDKYNKRTLRTLTLIRRPPPAVLNTFLKLTPNVQVKPHNPKTISTLTLIKLRARDYTSKSCLDPITEGLRLLPGITYLYHTGQGTVLAGPVTQEILTGLVASLINSYLVDYYIHGMKLIIGNGSFALELTNFINPPPPPADITTLALIGIEEETPCPVILRALGEIGGDTTTARYAQDASDKRAIIFDIHKKFNPTSFGGFAHRELAFLRLASAAPYTNIGQHVKEVAVTNKESNIAAIVQLPNSADEARTLELALRQTSLATNKTPELLSGRLKDFAEFARLAEELNKVLGKCEIDPSCAEEAITSCACCHLHGCQYHGSVTCPHTCDYPNCDKIGAGACHPPSLAGCGLTLCLFHLELPCPDHSAPQSPLDLTTARPMVSSHDLAIGSQITSSTPDPEMTSNLSSRILSPAALSLIEDADSTSQFASSCGIRHCVNSAHSHCEVDDIHLCRDHQSDCPHTTCKIPFCGRLATFRCPVLKKPATKKKKGTPSQEPRECAKELCELHAHTTCPRHDMMCGIPGCRKTALHRCPRNQTSLASTPVHCVVGLCDSHKATHTECPHTNCELCNLAGKQCCNKGCLRLLCLHHINATTCPNHSLVGDSILPDAPGNGTLVSETPSPGKGKNKKRSADPLLDGEHPGTPTKKSI